MKCINCGKEATSFDGLWCLDCLGDEATKDDIPNVDLMTVDEEYCLKRVLKGFVDFYETKQ